MTDKSNKNSFKQIEPAPTFNAVIDYPRHIRFNNRYTSVAQIQNTLRKQRTHHSEYDPALNSIKTQKLLDGVYVPNSLVSQKEATRDIFVHLKKQGNFESNFKLGTKEDLIKIYGEPLAKENKFAKRQQVYDSRGQEMTKKDI